MKVVSRSLCLALMLGFSLLGFSPFSPLPPRVVHAYLKGFAPQDYPSQQRYGQGVYFAPPSIALYCQPSWEAPRIETYQWQADNARVVISKRSGQPVAAKRLLTAFYPELDLAMMPVLQDNGEGWVEVIYDQGKQLTAWTPLRGELEAQDKLGEASPAHWGIYQSWYEFMRLNAKRNGIYWLTGVNAYDRAVRMSPQDEAKFLPVTIIRDMRVRHIRGNWLLVEVLDINKHRPLGWVRWRDKEGQLMVFTNFSGQQQVYVPNF